MVSEYECAADAHRMKLLLDVKGNFYTAANCNSAGGNAYFMLLLLF